MLTSLRKLKMESRGISLNKSLRNFTLKCFFSTINQVSRCATQPLYNVTGLSLLFSFSVANTPSSLKQDGCFFIVTFKAFKIRIQHSMLNWYRKLKGPRIHKISSSVRGFFRACKNFGRMFNPFLPAPFFLFFEVETSSWTLIPLFYARISPQWLSELRRLWPNVPWQVACELFPDRFPHYAWTAA